MLNPKFEHILCCPDCLLRLSRQPSDTFLYCQKCNTSYSIIDGVPILLSQQTKNTIENDVVKFQKRKFAIEKASFFKFLKPPLVVLNLSKEIQNLIPQFRRSLVLNLGAGSQRFEGNVINLDIEFSHDVDIIADAHSLPFPDNCFDAVICTAVLEHTRDSRKVVSEIKRVLKKDGYVYAEIPFLQGFHPDPTDYVRYTINGIEELFSDFQKIKSGITSGPSSTLSWILREYPGCFFNNFLIYKILKFIFGWLTFPIKYLDYIQIKKKNAHFLASGFFFLGKKQ